MKKVVFITGTRADFGKIKPLIQSLQELGGFDIQIFTTGMHMLSRYGSTWQEVVKTGIGHIHPFVNQSPGDGMDQVLSKTISGLSDFIKEGKPDLIIVHGDRVEALAGAAVGALNNIRVCHIEGGELSGTVDEILRHAISKLSHVHFVANEQAKSRLVQMGELPNSIYVIGSPDIDVMESPNLPHLDATLSHYGLENKEYGILIFHPVTTELQNLAEQIQVTLESLAEHGTHMIVIESNNDTGSEVIQSAYQRYSNDKRFSFFPSMRFEFFLTLLKNASFMIGNSSAGVREAPHFGVPAINLGSRQRNRVISKLVLDTPVEKVKILEAIQASKLLARIPEKNFGDGTSATKFKKVLSENDIWTIDVQKQFKDQEEAAGQ